VVRGAQEIHAIKSMLNEEESKLNKAVVISEDPIKIRKKLEETLADSSKRTNSIQLRASLDKRVAGAIEEVLKGFNSGATQISLQSALKSQV